MIVYDFNSLIKHLGHNIKIVTYGYGENGNDIINVAIECNDCNEVLLDFDKTEVKQKNI